VFASDLFSKLEAHKTAEGKVDEGSLGATVDLHGAAFRRQAEER
jgi:hypothetical protein